MELIHKIVPDVPLARRSPFGEKGAHRFQAILP